MLILFVGYMAFFVILIRWTCGWSLTSMGEGMVVDNRGFWFHARQEYCQNFLCVWKKVRTQVAAFCIYSFKVHIFEFISFGDVYKLTMYNDMKIVVVGYGIMFLYVAIMLGRFNMIEQRVIKTQISKKYLFLICIFNFYMNLSFSLTYQWLASVVLHLRDL